MPHINNDDRFDPPALDHGARYHIEHLGPTFHDTLDDGAIVDLDNRCAEDDCAERHLVVLDVNHYDDLVCRAAALDALVARAPRQLVAHYAALAANGYRGTWHDDGSVTWEPPTDDPASEQ